MDSKTSNKKEAFQTAINISWMLKALIIIWAPATDCTKSPHQQLRDDLMSGYGDVFIRPVKDVSTPTEVSIRPLFYNLIEMDLKKQQFTIDTRLKLEWIDQFLMWDPTKYNGTNRIRLPAEAVWKPDITFHENVDLFFQRFKHDTIVEVASDGTVDWYVPCIFLGGCAMRVTWFPFDIQVCNMTFTSYAYTGNKLVLIPDTGEDARQNRFLENGVWDMVATNHKQITSHYTCCDYPSYEVQYRLILRRHPEFYVRYLIVPVILLSVLSLMVFYLPPESGEKVTLCITNWLALVVFQQIIYENLPPNGSESPFIDIFFLSMFIFVSSSVIATISVIHINGISRKPVPRWVHWLVLKKLSRLVCLDAIKAWHHSTDTKTAVTKSDSFDDQLKHEEQNRHDWKLVSLVVDRYLMVIFSTVTLLITLILIVAVVVGSHLEFVNEMEILNNSWKLSTEQWL